VRASVLRFAQRLLFAVGFSAIAYSGGVMAYAKIYQKYEAWDFERILELRDLKQLPPLNYLNLREGDLIGRLDIERLDLSVMILEGVATDTLRVAGGHVPGTRIPDAKRGNTVIAAHRDTLFRKLEGIQVGDHIHFSTSLATYEYVVESTEIVKPENTRVLESRSYAELTLITCFPFRFVGSAPDRFIVHARLVTE
jgi:sortase A